MRTLRTGLAGIFRVDGYHPDPGQLCLVLDKGSQLRERPVMQFSSDFAVNPAPQANSGQIFQHNRLVRALRSLDKLLADRVVLNRGKAAFFERTLFQKAFCALCAPALKASADFAMTFTQVSDVCACQLKQAVSNRFF